MWVLDVEEMESTSKIDLRDVLWWTSIEDANRLGALKTVILSKRRVHFFNYKRKAILHCT